ncbi:DUF4038 domain-containing protein [Emticicia sp. BO119]|uniref:apiosidase-like domain-containing protein n=1 Tax=Emticicia sp. BO119 TaxID=2757768 RepID=UPI0015F03E85|nr:DUF4038 domain-containing protein [Emticicia sp. BO119]MBA4851270.1 DUF4038 domain-containing protein [Emticicia sp. BO119]
MPNLPKFLSLLTLLLSHSLISSAQNTPAFPLKLSENKRYLIDSKGKPFLVKEFSAWGAIQVLSEKDEGAFLDSLKEEGFNTVMVSVVSNAPSQMGGNPPYWQGISPFTTKWDFSTPNEAYFKHVDNFFTMAAQRGMFVMALPFYMGYRGDGSQGWWDELLNPNNSPAKMTKYGEFIGDRYKNTPNVMWVAGGDNNTEGDFYTFEINMLKAIKAKAPHQLWTGHFDCNLSNFWSTQNKLYADLMDIDGEYVWTESLLFEEGPQYVSELKQYKKGKMIMQLDLSYEHDVPHYADNENYQWMRRKMYDGLLSGCAGTSFSSGEMTNQCYSFKNWKPLMNTRGMKQVAHCFQLFDALPWHTFVPDETNQIIISGRGEFGALDYVCAAMSADRKYYIMYIPKGHPINVNVKNMSGNAMRMHWYNSGSGQALKIGTVQPRERFGIVPPSEEDWVIVFDDDKDFKMLNLMK